MLVRLKAHAWLLGVTLLPVVLALVVHPLGRRWA